MSRTPQISSSGRTFEPDLRGDGKRAFPPTRRNGAHGADAQRMSRFGLTRREAMSLRRLTPAWRIQQFLDATAYDVAGAACRSPRRVLRERTAQCLDGALFAAAALTRTKRRAPRLARDREHQRWHSCRSGPAARGLPRAAWLRGASPGRSPTVRCAKGKVWN
jgi:hypothetical protein